MNQRRRAGFTLVEVLAVGMVVLVALCLFIPVIAASGRSAKIEGCSANLKALYQLAASVAGEAPTGRVYWTRLNPPPELLRCPLAQEHPLEGSDYMGPGQTGGKLANDLPLGCDVPSNHSLDGQQGGNVLLRSGRVITDHTDLWRAAFQGACKP